MSYLTGFAVQPNKAIVGANAFAHESGIHQDGVIKNPLTYEIMTPQSVGLGGSTLSIGKLSGRKGLQGKLRELGHDLDGEALDAIYRAAIALADTKKEVTDADLLALVERRAGDVPRSIELLGWSVTSSSAVTPWVPCPCPWRARNGRPRPGATGRSTRCSVRSMPRSTRRSGGTRCSRNTRSRRCPPVRTRRARCSCAAAAPPTRGPARSACPGHGLSTNIIEASLEAYLVAANKLHGAEINGVSVAFVGRRTAERPAVTTYRLVSLPGDGVGPSVVDAAKQVLAAAGAAHGFDIAWTELTIGGAAIDAYGTAYRDQDIEVCRGADAILLGAVGGPKWDDPTSKVRPEQVLFALRGGLGLFANLRPVTIHPALVPASPLRPELLRGVDLLIVRELTGGIYFGERSEASGEPGQRTALDTLPYSEFEVRRVVALAFALAPLGGSG